MKKLTLLLFIVLSTPAFAEEQSCRILLAGDSTMQDVDPHKNPDFGWGQILPNLAKPTTLISNHAKGGRSTRTFIEEGRWQRLLDAVNEGDWVFIQFGHNDASYQKPERYTAPVDYRRNLSRFVTDVKAKGGNPLLITPVMRRWFDRDGKLRDAHGIYPSLVRAVAQEHHIPLVDLFESSSQLLSELGVDESITLFAYVDPGEHPCCPYGQKDNTHFSKRGATQVAALVVKEIKTKALGSLPDCFTQLSQSE